MQTVLKPNFLVVPQLAHSELAGNRANLRTFCSAGVKDMVDGEERGCRKWLEDKAAVTAWCCDCFDDDDVTALDVKQ